MRTKTAAALLLAVLAACDGAGLPDVSGSDGALRFDYDGTLSGSFVAAGNGVTGAEPEWAVGLQSRGWITVQGLRVLPDGRRDQLSFAFPEQDAPYTIRFDWSECLADAPCPGGLAILAYQPGAPETGREFSFSSGEIRVSSIDGGRVRGTFAGSGNELSGSGTSTLRYSSGSFDVPLVPGP